MPTVLPSSHRCAPSLVLVHRVVLARGRATAWLGTHALALHS